jgi:hypothetical protein
MKFVLSSLFTNIGSCSFCIQTAFRAALAAGGTFCILAVLKLANVVSFPSSATYLALGTFLMLTALWILHVVVFGIRSAHFLIKNTGGVDVQKHRGEIAIITRRNYLKTATQSALSIAVFTVANSMLISSASASVQCGNRGVFCATVRECCIWGDGTATCCPGPKGECSYQPGVCGD